MKHVLKVEMYDGYQSIVLRFLCNISCFSFSYSIKQNIKYPKRLREKNLKKNSNYAKYLKVYTQ